MNEEGIFNAKYEKTLELVEKISPKLVENIYNSISQMPAVLKKYISKEKSCELNGLDKTIELQMEGSLMELRYTLLKNNLNTFIYVYPFYAAELKELPEDNDNIDDHSMLLASITKTNTDDEIGTVRYFYTEKDANYTLNSCKIENNSFEWDYSVYLDIVDGKYYLNYVISFNDEEYKTKQIEVYYDELLKYACDDYDEFDEEYKENDGFIDSFGLDEQ